MRSPIETSHAAGVRDVASAEAPTTWVEAGGFRHQARCTCAWTGPKRTFFRTLAPLDALIHAARAGCVPAAPIHRPPFCDPPATPAA